MRHHSAAQPAKAWLRYWLGLRRNRGKRHRFCDTANVTHGQKKKKQSHFSSPTCITKIQHCALNSKKYSIYSTRFVNLEVLRKYDDTTRRRNAIANFRDTDSIKFAQLLAWCLGRHDGITASPLKSLRIKCECHLARHAES